MGGRLCQFAALCCAWEYRLTDVCKMSAGSQIQPATLSAKTPRVMVRLAIRVDRATMLAASDALPPIALTMTKLAAAVGLAKNRNSTPSSRPSKPAPQAARVASSGSVTIFSKLELTASCPDSRMEPIDRVAPMQMSAKGRVSEAK